MKRKAGIIITVAVLLLILLFPVSYELKDGGSIEYKSLTYKIKKVHTLITDEEMRKEGKIKPYYEGLIIEILGFKIFDNVE